MKHGMKIVIVESGWVFVGNVETDAEWATITDAQNVRLWGTTKGLGELASNGPTSSTKLDQAGTVLASRSHVIAMLDVNADKWPACKCVCGSCKCNKS